MRDHQARRPLVQYQLPRLHHLGQLPKQPFNTPRIRYQIVDNLRPRFIQSLIPNTRREELYRRREAFGCLAYVLCALFEELLSQARLDEVHLVDQDEDGGGGGDDGGVGDYVGGELAGFNVEDEDEDCDGAEDVGALVREVVFDEAVLPAHAVSTHALPDPSATAGGVLQQGGSRSRLTLRNPRGSASSSP
jgi:hypothetical protein